MADDRLMWSLLPNWRNRNCQIGDVEFAKSPGQSGCVGFICLFDRPGGFACSARSIETGMSNLKSKLGQIGPKWDKSETF